ncbi:MAG: hypothetical protein ACRDJT_03420 [Actinomycetota bacterium]
MSTFFRHLCGLLLLLCLAPGCNSESPDLVAPRSDAPSTTCSNEEEMRADGSARRGGTSGDVTGDGAADEVFIAVDEEAEIGCRALLFVRSDGGTRAASLDVEDTDLGLGLPALSGLKQIDGDGGSDVIVDMAAGASTLFAGVFVFADGGLDQIRIEGSQPPAENLFAHGGGIAQLSAAGCAAEGVIVSTAVAEGRRYRVDRHTYEFDRAVLARNPAMDETERLRLEMIPRSFPEFAGPPFSSCPDA